MPDPVRLRPQADVDPVDVPEVLVISALLESGEFLPGRYRVDESMLSCYGQVWRFAVDYQEQAKAAPSMALVRKKFPDFPAVTGVNASWAAKQLLDADWERGVRRTANTGLQHLKAGDHDSAQAVFAAMASPRLSTVSTGLSAKDPRNANIGAIRAGWPTPDERLTKLTHGICDGDVWTIGARFGVGKSWKMPGFAAVVAEAGARGRYVSLEMPAEQINHRVHLWWARGNPEAVKALRSRTKSRRLDAIAALAESVPGDVEVVDPSMTRITVGTLEALLDDVDVLFVDHAGLLTDRRGRRAIEDWKIAAEISNEVKEIALRARRPIMQAVQINREGETNGFRTPRFSKVSQTDAFGQDADFGITMSRPTSGVWMNSLEKSRYAKDKGVWYTRFDPETVDFSEISKDQALEIERDEKDRAGDD